MNLRVVGPARHNRRIRALLALLRLFLLFSLACWLALQMGFQIDTMRRQGSVLNRTATRPLDLPFVGTTVMLERMTPDERRSALDRLNSHGVGWVRQRFDWNVLEPEPGRHEWQTSDAMIAAINSTGLTPIVVLDGSPDWARAAADLPPTENPLAPPADPTSFARFAAAFAGRYGAQVRYYQVWDEPNIAPHWGNRHVEPVHYAQLLIEASRAIRAADDDAVIISAALAPTTDRGHTAIDEVTFLQRMYAAGIQPHVDIVAIEPFGFGHSAQTPARAEILNFQRAALVRRAMLAAGDGETPLLAARFGWNSRPPSPWRTVSPADQRAFLSDALAIGWQQWPWLAGLGWAVDQPMAPMSDPVWGLALDDGLLHVLEAWSAEPSALRGRVSASFPWGMVFFLAAMVVVLWRGWAAQALLPWHRWRHGYLNLPFWVQIGIWAGLIVLYHLATWPPALALLLVAAACLIAMQPFAGLWLAAALLPFTFQHKALHTVNITFFIAPAQAVVLAALPAMIGRLHTLWRRRRAGLSSRLRPLDWFGLSWLALTLLAGINVWHWPGYFDGVIDLVITPLLLYAMVRLLAPDLRFHVGAAIALLAGGVAVALVGLVHWVLGGGTEADAVRRLVGPYFSANHAALYLERTLFLGMGFWLTQRNLGRLLRERRGRRAIALLLFGVILLVAAALLLTASRGALLLGVPAGLALFAWLAMDGSAGRSRWFWPVLGVALLGAVALAFIFWPRVSNMATMVQRVDVWQASVRLWRETPFFGVGPGGFFWRYPAFAPVGSLLDPNLRHPHNVWLEFAALWGLLGLLWFVALLGWVIRRIWTERYVLRVLSVGYIATGLLAGLTAGLAHGQVDAFGALADIAAWNWLALGLWRAFVNDGRRQDANERTAYHLNT